MEEQIKTLEDKLKAKSEQYEKLKSYSADQEKLMQDILNINKSLIKTNEQLSTSLLRSEKENIHLKKTNSKGVFIEYDNDPKTLEFIPIMTDLTQYTKKEKKPTKMMYTFKFKDFETWVLGLGKMMSGNTQNIQKVDEDLIRDD